MDNKKKALARRSRMRRRAKERQALLDRGVSPAEASKRQQENQRRIAARAAAPQTKAVAKTKAAAKKVPSFSMKMKKMELLAAAQTAGLSHISKANTKAEIYGALKAAYA